MKVYDVIKAAEELYIEELKKIPEYYPGMCWCLKVAAANIKFKNSKSKVCYITYKGLVANIPEFNPEFLKATKSIRTAGLDFWWDLNDKQSRLNAFRLLRNIYKQSDKEFIY